MSAGPVQFIHLDRIAANEITRTTFFHLSAVNTSTLNVLQSLIHVSHQVQAKHPDSLNKAATHYSANYSFIMPIRNPFARRDVQTGLAPYEEGVRPLSQNGNARPTFEKVDTTGSKGSSAMSISSKKSQEPVEYKMSVVNDSGVYLPPSPPEKKGFWPRRSNPSGTSTSTRNSESDIEPFSISRESFDSYRRSFDISARSPVVSHEVGRQSLDSARLPRLPRSAINERRFERQPPTAEEGFEDVGLNDEQAKQTKKKGFFSKFGENSDPGTQSPTTSRFHLPGRKRGQSGVGEELGNLPRPSTSGSKEVKEVH